MLAFKVVVWGASRVILDALVIPKQLSPHLKKRGRGT